MAITVGTNSYITEAELAIYALDRGITIVGDTKPLIIRAMDYLETRNYIGYKTSSTQVLQFPRVIDDYYYPSDTVPNEIKIAQCIASILIGQGNDLQAVISQSVKSQKVDVIEIVYQDNTTSYAQYTALNDALRPFIQSGIQGVRV